MANDKGGARSYDPLAWLQEEPPAGTPAVAEAEEAPVSAETVAPELPEEVAVDAVAEPAPTTLGEELTIVQAAELHGQWLALLAGEGPVTLDASQVMQVDAAGIQLLLAFARTLEARGRKLVLEAPAPALCRGAALLGVAEMLGLDGQEAA